jgi:hypothetical protein
VGTARKEWEMRHTLPARLGADAHYIDQGSVWCPVTRTDVDVDRCFACGAFRELVEAEGRTFLVCKPAPPQISPETVILGM